MDKKVLMWNEKGRKAEVLDRYYESLGKDNCEKIESAAMDGAKNLDKLFTKIEVEITNP